MTKSRVFRSLLLSYAAVLILPMLLCSFVFYHTAGEIERQLRVAHQTALSTLRETADSSIKEAYAAVAYIITNDDTQTLKTKPRFGAEDMSALRALRDRVSQYVAQSAIIDNMFVYFPGADMLVGRDSVTGGQDARRLLQDEMRISWETWLQYTRMDTMRTQQLYAYEDAAGRAGTRLLLLQKSNKADASHPGSVVVAVLASTQALQSILSDYYQDGALRCAISGGGDLIQYKDNDASLFSGPGVMAQPSRVSALTYLMVPGNGVSRTLRTVQRLFALYYLLSLSVGAALCWYLSMRSYSPLQKLLSNLLGSLNLAHPSDRDEYASIERMMRDTLTSMRDSNQQLATYKNAGRDAFLRRLLHGRVGTAAREEADALGLDFQSERFCVTLYSLESVNISINSGGDEALSVNLIDFIITTMMQEMALPGCRKYAFTQSDMLCCLINLPEQPDAQERAALENDARRTIDYLSKRLNLTMTAAISRPYTVREGLSGGYYEAKEALTYLKLLGMSGQAMHISDVNQYNSVNEMDFSRSLDAQRRLLNAVSTDDFARARACTDELFNLYFEHPRDLTSRQMDLRLSSLIHIFVSAFGQCAGGAPAEGAQCTESLYQCTDLSALRACAGRILEQLEKSASRMPEDDRNLRLIDYIRAHYTDAELNVSSLSEKFQLTPSYCSQLIRHRIGKSALDYIQELRVAHAKKLLADTALPLKAIAEAVGFGSSLNMIRAFKRMEELTPSTYRELHRHA